MLRYLLNILLILTFSVAVSGITISRHYSGGKLYDVALHHKADSCCPTDDCGCCRNEGISLKIQDDFVHIVSLDMPQAKVVELTSASASWKDISEVLPTTNEILKYYSSKSPPLLYLHKRREAVSQVFRC